MAVITRNRTIKATTRSEKSKTYKIDTKGIFRDDILVVNINHETKTFHKTFKFKGSDVEKFDSISFRIIDSGTAIEIIWSSVKPFETLLPKAKTKKAQELKLKKTSKTVSGSISTHLKTSFAPISDAEIEILILGSMPGDKSLELGEYYGHARNRFWKIISTITKNDLPLNYSEKKELLKKSKIGVWDVAHKATRKGSLDSAIKDEEPNDLDNFISKHENIKVIAFNGLKSRALFDKYFKRKEGIKYISLPSTSPANAGIDFEGICKVWGELLSL